MGSQATGSHTPQSRPQPLTATDNENPNEAPTAQPSIQANGPPGLKAIRISGKTANTARTECEAALSAHQSEGKHRAIEVGKPYFDQRANHPAHSISDFPEVESLIRTAHAGFGHAEPPWDRINIIIRSYRKGGRLTPHIDRPDLFGEDVYTCVLANTSRSRLTFTHPNAKSGAIQRSNIGYRRHQDSACTSQAHREKNGSTRCQH